MPPDRLLTVFKMCVLAIEMNRPVDLLATHAMQFGASFGVTAAEAEEVLALPLNEIARRLAARPQG